MTRSKKNSRPNAVSVPASTRVIRSPPIVVLVMDRGHDRQAADDRRDRRVRNRRDETRHDRPQRVDVAPPSDENQHANHHCEHASCCRDQLEGGDRP